MEVEASMMSFSFDSGEKVMERFLLSVHFARVALIFVWFASLLMRVVMSCGTNSGRSKLVFPGKQMVQVFLEKVSRLETVMGVGRVEPSQVVDWLWTIFCPVMLA